jgi:hypothetical protein
VLDDRLAEVAQGYVFEAGGLRILGELTKDAWRKLGAAVKARREGSSWALGDWVLYASMRQEWGATYTLAARATGYSEKYLSRVTRVSEAFPPSDRMTPPLTWSHHECALSVDGKKQRLAALQVAVEHRMTVDLFEEYLDKEFPRLTSREAGAKGRVWNEVRAKHGIPVDERVRPAVQVQCPHCSRKFPLHGNRVKLVVRAVKAARSA